MTANGALSLPVAINYILQVADALEHAAACGVTHRDVKPSNILITKVGSAKLIDMGLARLLKPTSAEDELTASGVTLGTFDYISPEQARDPREADVRSDIYSLGCTFFFMLTGQPPFPEGTVLQKLLKHQGDSPPDVRDFSPHLPPEVSQIIRKMMAKAPKDRFQTPKALIDVLAELAEMIGLMPPAPGESTWRIPEVTKPSGILRHLPWLIAVSLLFVCFFGVRYFFDSKSNNLLPRVPVLGPEQGTGSDALLLPGRTVTEQQATPGDLKSGTSPDRRNGLTFLATELLTENDFEPEVDTPVPFRSGGRTTPPASQMNVLKAVTLQYPQRLAGGFRIASVSSPQYAATLRSGVRIAPEQEVAARFLGSADTASQFNWGLGTDLLLSNSPMTSATTVAEQANSFSLVVDRIGKASGSYATLQAALSAAFNLSRAGRAGEAVEIQIELRFSGPLEVPFTSLTNRRVSITGGTGFQPVLAYKPNETSSGGTGERMFLLSGSELKFKNVSINFAVPSDEIVATDWSVFELFGGSTLTFNEGTITVLNNTSDTNFSPLHTNVAFFRKSLTAGETVAIPTGTEKTSSVIANRAILRGEAVLFHCPEKGFGRIKVSTSGINVSGALLKCEDTDGEGRNDGPIELAFDRVIAICRNSVIRHERKEGNAPLFPVSVSLINSVIKLSGTPLISSLSSYPVEETTDVLNRDFENTTFLNLSSYRVHRRRQLPDRSYESPAISLNDKKLESYSTDAMVKIDSIPPHLFSREDFYQYIYLPLDSNINTPAERKVLEELNEFFFGN